MSKDFLEFLRDLDDEARADGPEAVAEMEALVMHYRKLVAILAPDPLPPIAPMRIASLDEAKVIRVKGIVDSTDRDRCGVAIQTPMTYRNPVPIIGEEGKTIGFALLSVEGNKVMAEATICYATPERLSLEVGDKLWFLSNGWLYESDDPDVLCVTRVESLTLSRTNDNETDPVEVVS